MFTDVATCGLNLGVPRFQEQEVAALTEQNVILT